MLRPGSDPSTNIFSADDGNAGSTRPILGSPYESDYRRWLICVLVVVKGRGRRLGGWKWWRE